MYTALSDLFTAVLQLGEFGTTSVPMIQPMIKQVCTCQQNVYRSLGFLPPSSSLQHPMTKRFSSITFFPLFSANAWWHASCTLKAKEENK